MGPRAKKAPRIAFRDLRCRLRLPSAVALALVVLALAATTASAEPRFGAWNPGSPYGGTVASADALQSRIGRKVEIVNWFQNWGGGPGDAEVQARDVRAITDSGRTPLLTWEPRVPGQPVAQPAYTLAAIAAGAHDDYVARFARALRDLGSPVYLRPMHEFNGDWYPWGTTVGGNTPEQFVAAWRHLHDVFAAQGATNVRWVWSPMNEDRFGDRPLEAFYPGTAYVDVLAADGYNWGDAFGGWLSFGRVFDAVYGRLSALGPQPIWLAEVGVASIGGDKGAWVRDMFARAEKMPRLAAIVWFNENKERDWRIDADPNVAAGFAPGAALALDAQAPGVGHVGIRGASSHDAGRVVPAGASRGASAARYTLRLTARARVRRGRRAVLRWAVVGAAPKVRRWTIYLDGRRVRTLGAGRARKLKRRVSRPGRHRWRVVGRDARGHALIASQRTFRVVG